MFSCCGCVLVYCFFHADDGIGDHVLSHGVGDVCDREEWCRRVCILIGVVVSVVWLL